MNGLKLLPLLHVLQLCLGANPGTLTGPRADVNGGSRGTIHAYEGDDALLTCVIRGAGDNTVMWKMEDVDRHSKRVLTAGPTRVTADKRFHILHDEGGDVWVLAIKNVKAEDAGIYICEVNSDPVVRSFHKLAVLSRDLQPPSSANGTIHYGTDAIVAEAEDRSDKGMLLKHNYTRCCREYNVSAKCLGFCVIQNILEGNTGQDPEQCENDFPSIVKCMADGRNHVPCCVQEGVPDICQDVCRGEYTVITDNIKTHFSCSAYTEQTLACIVEGIELLPSGPENVEAIVLSENSVNVSWSKPSNNRATVTEYAVNVTMLKSFDNDPFMATEITSMSIVTPHSIQVKVPGINENLLIRNLTAYTMYEISVTAKNMHGSSLPSFGIRVVTLPVGKKKADTKGGLLPPLPDIKACCVKKGITHNTCLEKLCNPAKSDTIEVTDLMICAPWASQAYSCLTNGIDHTPCCKSRGLPNLCLEQCAGNITQIDYSHFKCLQYMGEYTNCLMRGYGVVPASPTRLRVSNVDVDFALLMWEPPKVLNVSVDHYNVYYRQLDDIYMVARKVHSPYVLEKLRPEALYEVYVEAVNAHGPGEPSQRVIFRTLSVKLIEREELEPISYNITECCTSTGLSDICLPLCSYDASMSQLKTLAGICGVEFHKLIRCGAGGRNHVGCCQRRGVPTSCLPICTGVLGKSVTSAPPSTCIPYIGNIVQCFEEGTGLLPGPVTELHALKLTNDTATIAWKGPEDGSQISDYVVHYQKANNVSVYESDSYAEKQTVVSETSATIESLETGSAYNIYVVSRNKHGTSLPSSILLLNATERDLSKMKIAGVPSPPHSLAVSSHSANYVTISWQPPEYSHPAERLLYNLYWRASAETSYHMRETELTVHMMDNLTPNSQYIVYVVARSKTGASLPSETLVAWTDPSFPAFVEAPSVHPMNMVVEGNTMTILCIAMGTPMPTISLYISGRLVRQETTRHMVTVVNNVTRDMNHISCYADNGYGTPMQASRKININYIPSIVPDGITMTGVGDTVVLECAVDAYPEPKMMFWRDPSGRVPVIEGGKYNFKFVQPKDENGGEYLMQLAIEKISDDDAGDYYCHAENAFGASTQPVSVRIRNTPPSHNVTECCMKQNVSSDCMESCSVYLDVDAVLDKPECVNDMNKLMKCASDGSDHRNCCGSLQVPRSCLDWCRGEPVENNGMCLLVYTKPIMSCFREGRSKLPGPPQNIRLEIVDNHSVFVKWDPPAKNPGTAQSYRVFWRALGSRSVPNKNDTKDESLLITGLKDDTMYELVLKATNQMGASMLTEPVKFSTSEKYVTSAASLDEDSGSTGTFGAVFAFLLVSCAVGAVLYYLHSRQYLINKSTNNVAFENPSYLREGQPENLNQENSYSISGITANGQQWKPETLHVPTEVPPSLYEELRLGSEGAGFMKLKP